MNLHCAFGFLINPERYAPSYQLGNTPGEAAIQGFGILFLMWNVPYIVALIHPVKFRISLIQSVIMQAIGLFGETYIFLTLPDGFPTLSGSILRFVIFDGGGLIALVVALILSLKVVNTL